MVRLTRVAPELPAADLPKAIAYYEQRLGFKVAMQMPAGDYAVMERDGIALHLFVPEAGAQNPIALHIFTPDLDALYAEYVGNGGRVTQTIEKKPWGNREFRVQDEFGNVLKFTEPLAQG